MDDIDRSLLTLLQADASQSYATLGQSVGLSTGAAHERVRKLRERGVIRRTTIEVDHDAVGRGMLAFVLVEASTWMGSDETRDALMALPDVQEAHIVAGSASLLLKIRTATTEDLQVVLRRIYELDQVLTARSVVVLETFFERPLEPVQHSGS
ncbi:Lrp/AsnC family transcriptional regulator [Labedaea rhizosphaerae]|uniref:AsnC family transcriptional regulator n=1 Tax=Labedaea rhizosphaerae TaxID=598644 RepID=A0A4R6RXB4_LABRH|nr:Lrp/AsnC family transcriptional regulator [Labedaea rhizosphaerae]TDP91157.1 AsnC family transcriptional regulator [Labedaea rhizosphaerae]